MSEENKKEITFNQDQQKIMDQARSIHEDIIYLRYIQYSKENNSEFLPKEKFLTKYRINQGTHSLYHKMFDFCTLRDLEPSEIMENIIDLLDNGDLEIGGIAKMVDGKLEMLDINDFKKKVKDLNDTGFYL